MKGKVTLRDAWSGEADCRNCALRDSALFAGLQETDFEKIHQPINQFLLQPGQILYHAGEQGDRLFTIRSGLIKLVQYLPDGSQRIVRLVRKADITGLESLLGKPYQHEAVVMHPTEVCCLPVSTVQTLSKDNPNLGTELLKRWDRALSEADAWLTELSTGPAKERIGRLLLRLVQDEDPPVCTLFGREDLGAMLAITTETASRIIAEFKRKGVLTDLGGNRFAVDRAQLEALLHD